MRDLMVCYALLKQFASMLDAVERQYSVDTELRRYRGNKYFDPASGGCGRNSLRPPWRDRYCHLFIY